MQEENILIQAGLSEEQALVYQSLLDKGPQRASDLAKWTGIKRGLIYKVLEQLESMGLVSKQGGPGTVATFSPSHPSLLLSNIEKKEKEIALNKEMLMSYIGALSSKYNLIIGKPNVQFFEGKEGIIKIYDQVLNSGTKLIDSFEDKGEMSAFIPEYFPQFIKKRVKLGIRNRVIAPKDNQININSEEEMRETKFFPTSLFPFEMDIKITDRLVSMITFQKDQPVGILIDNQEIASNFGKLFNLVWELAKNNSEQSEPKKPSPSDE